MDSKDMTTHGDRSNDTESAYTCNPSSYGCIVVLTPDTKEVIIEPSDQEIKTANSLMVLRENICNYRHKTEKPKKVNKKVKITIRNQLPKKIRNYD